MQLSEALGPDDFARGDLAAPIVVLHYGDFECPYSAALHPVAEQVRAKFKGRMCLVFRHFPLDDVHPRALAAALAAEAAAQQGAFWPMHDRLFENQGAFEDDDLAAYARDGPGQRAVPTGFRGRERASQSARVA
jgi:protein-disulfide isomerase